MCLADYAFSSEIEAKPQHHISKVKRDKADQGVPKNCFTRPRYFKLSLETILKSRH